MIKLYILAGIGAITLLALVVLGILYAIGFILERLSKSNAAVHSAALSAELVSIEGKENHLFTFTHDEISKLLIDVHNHRDINLSANSEHIVQEIK